MVVYLLEQNDHFITVKIIHPSQSWTIEFFLAPGKVVAVEASLEVGVEWLMMSWVAGFELQKMIKNGCLPPLFF